MTREKAAFRVMLPGRWSRSTPLCLIQPTRRMRRGGTDAYLRALLDDALTHEQAHAPDL